MDKMSGRHMIKALRSKWILYTILSDALMAAGISFLLAILANKLLGWSACWGILFGCIVFVGLLVIHQVWLVKETAVAQLLDQNYPQLEESTGLLLQSPPSLNMLEQLQYKRTNDALLTIDAPLSISKKIRMPAFIMVITLVTGI
ncbi:MAG TPA: hypothetical protein VK645_12940, partial [Chitinophagaceae bacterium]|nr:hypothetical protein [Chitinophagaceae bacterium]